MRKVRSGVTAGFTRQPSGKEEGTGGPVREPRCHERVCKTRGVCEGVHTESVNYKCARMCAHGCA